MSKKLADCIIQKAAHMIDNEASCSKHHDQNLVMFESDKEFFGCQQCIFEGNHPNPEFITLKAREISDRYKSNYD
jgi:hypothetical protein